MKRMALLCLMFTLTAPVLAQVNIGNDGTISGRVYTDYYWIAQNHNKDLEGNNGFWFRRIYLTYNHQISDAFSGRLRFDMSSKGDFATDAKLDPVVKDAYLRWSNDDHAITVGITSPPTLGLAEDIWGYRSVEKSPLDFYDFAGSREFGISFKGNLDSEDRLKYNFMFANGSGRSTELDKGKKLMLSLSYYLTKHLVVQAYGDWNNKPENLDIYTTQGVVGYRSNGFNLGALYAYQIREMAGEDLNLDLVSFFGNAQISESLKGFARVDHLFDPNPTGPGNDYIPISDQAESTFMTGGVDVSLEENIHLIPNVEAIVYGEDAAGQHPDTDIIPRLTLFYGF